MFRLSYTTPCEIQGAIRVNKPVMGLGYVTDVKGRKWDVHAIFGAGGVEAQIVHACRVENLHPYFRSTSSSRFGLVQQTWKPYRIEVTDGGQV